MPADDPQLSRAGPRSLGQLLAGALLLSEFMWIVGRFDTTALAGSSEGWARLMHQANHLPRIGLVLVTALLLFRRPELGSRPAGALSWRRTPGQWISLLGAQLAAYSLLFWTTARILEDRLAGVQFPWLWIGAWVGLCALTAILGVLLLQPFGALWRGFTRHAGLLLGILFLGTTAWAVGEFAADRLSEPLRGPTLWLSSSLLGLFEPDGFSDRARFVFGTPAFCVEIAPVCSGFEGMGLMLVFVSAYLAVFREQLRFPRALLLPIAGLAGVWLLNVLRLVALVLIGTHVSPRVAMGGFHSLAGTLAFCVAALGLVALSRRSRYFASGAAREDTAVVAQRDGTAAYLSPFLVTIAVGMLVGAFGEDGRLLVPLKPVAAALALAFFWRRYALEFRASSIAPLLAGTLAFAVWIAIPAPGTEPASGGWFALRIASSVCIEPFVEELAFRGYLLRRLCAPEFEQVRPGQVSTLAWGLSSLAFGALHGHWIASTVAGALYGLAYMRGGRILDAVFAHAWTNALLAAYALATGDGALL